MDKESYFLKKLINTGITKSLDDDCAWLSKLLLSNDISQNKKLPYIIAMDSFAENIHFRIHNYKKLESNHNLHTISRYTMPNQWLSYDNLAKKAFIVNISDMLSSGALPKYALLSICIPSYLTNKHIQEIINGLEKICKTYNIFIIGGDTMCGDRLEFHITMIGKLINKYISRNNVKKGDYLAYTSNRRGNLGNSLKTLKSLMRYGATINKIPLNIIESTNPYMRFSTPILRDKFIIKAHKFIHACLDISDGLANEINRLETLNKLHFLSFNNIKKQVYQSGEEYELLFSFNRNNLAKLQKIALITKTKLHVIGKFGFYKQQYFNAIKWHK